MAILKSKYKTKADLVAAVHGFSDEASVARLFPQVIKDLGDQGYEVVEGAKGIKIVDVG